MCKAGQAREALQRQAWEQAVLVGLNQIAYKELRLSSFKHSIYPVYIIIYKVECFLFVSFSLYVGAVGVSDLPFTQGQLNLVVGLPCWSIWVLQ